MEQLAKTTGLKERQRHAEDWRPSALSGDDCLFWHEGDQPKPHWVYQSMKKTAETTLLFTRQAFAVKKKVYTHDLLKLFT